MICVLSFADSTPKTQITYSLEFEFPFEKSGFRLFPNKYLYDWDTFRALETTWKPDVVGLETCWKAHGNHVESIHSSMSSWMLWSILAIASLNQTRLIVPGPEALLILPFPEPNRLCHRYVALDSLHKRSLSALTTLLSLCENTALILSNFTFQIYNKVHNNGNLSFKLTWIIFQTLLISDKVL